MDRNVPELPKTTQPIVITLGHPPESDAKTLLQETPLTLFPEHGEKMLAMTRKYSPARFQGVKNLKSVMQAAKGTWSPQQISPAVKP